jgi:hypothetical protein
VLFPRSRNNLNAVDPDAGRHHTEPQGQQDQLPDEELESYLAALSPDGDTEPTGSGGRYGSPQVYQLRLPDAAHKQLREIAAYRQTSPVTLAEEWIIQRLEWETRQQRH